MYEASFFVTSCYGLLDIQFIPDPTNLVWVSMALLDESVFRPIGNGDYICNGEYYFKHIDDDDTIGIGLYAVSYIQKYIPEQSEMRGDR